MNVDSNCKESAEMSRISSCPPVSNRKIGNAGLSHMLLQESMTLSFGRAKTPDKFVA